MAILRKILIMLPAFLLTGCFEEFQPEDDVAPVLCVNSLVTAGSPIYARVTHTWMYNDLEAERSHEVRDAVVRIFVNGQEVDKNYKARERDHVRIVADSPTYGHAEGEVTVPVSVMPLDVKITPVERSVETSSEDFLYVSLRFDLNVELTVPDDASTANYFNFKRLGYCDVGWDYDWGFDWGDDMSFVGPDATQADLQLGSFQYQSEPIFGEHIGIFDSVMGADSWGFLFFSDRQFSGDKYTLHLKYTDCRYTVVSANMQTEIPDAGFTFILSTVSESFYDWAIYSWQKSDGMLGDMSSIGLSEAFGGYSNVSSGAGIIAAQSSQSVTISLHDFIVSEFDKYGIGK
ncbi:MAG: DUF4249 domain-containing protein [Muribaculaceae bacterium]|nr:DUF4249 domain-containing protein [Muribaculaceae bacterium]